MQDTRECCRILDLEPGASLEDIKRAYRELVRVWHPDRFRNDPKLQAKAEEKLKLINLAYERLCQEAAEGGRRREAAAAEASRNPAEEAKRKAEASHRTGPAPERSRAAGSAAQAPPDGDSQAAPEQNKEASAPTPDEQDERLFRRVRGAAWAVAGLIVLVLIWADFKRPPGS